METIRAKFTKGKDLKYIGHLDLVRLFKRSFIRADIPIEYTQGFNPQPKLSFATALSLGVESDGEYLDVVVAEKIETDDFINKLNNVLPNGIKMIKAKYLEDNNKIMSLIKFSSYIIEMHLVKTISKNTMENIIKDILDKDEIIVTRKKKNKKNKMVIKETDVRKLIESIELLIHEDERIIIKTMLKTGSVGNLKPNVIVDQINKYEDIEIDEDMINIKRLELFIEEDGKIIPPL